MSTDKKINYQYSHKEINPHRQCLLHQTVLQKKSALLPAIMTHLFLLL